MVCHLCGIAGLGAAEHHTPPAPVFPSLRRCQRNAGKRARWRWRGRHRERERGRRGAALCGCMTCASRTTSTAPQRAPVILLGRLAGTFGMLRSAWPPSWRRARRSLGSGVCVRPRTLSGDAHTHTRTHSHDRRPGLKIVELGAGCGWLGLTVARCARAESCFC